MNTLENPSPKTASPARPEPESASVRVSLETHYLLQAPWAEPPPELKPLAIIATHGYGMNAQVMLDLVQLWYRGKYWIAAPQGPHGFYLSQRPGEGPEGFNWGFRSRRESSIATHHEVMHRVIEAVTARTGIPRQRVILAGFSQSVGMNYQFLARNPGAAGGAIGACGSPPKDWETNPEYQTVREPSLHITRTEDEYYTPEIQAALEARLRARLANLEYHSLPGQHRFPSRATPLVEAWQARHFGERDV